ncbi:MAG: S26 family signal peptidase [Candidatus Eremiobacteraeota bacterium]|nr:S26 family signal peptidase [Candidatus Eremiobacteraeota bacterium]
MMNGTTTLASEVRRRVKLARLVAFLVGLSCIVVVLHFSGFAVNVTDSMPLGLYRVVPAGRAPVKGDIVRLCVTPAIAALGRARNYLPHGPCSHSTAPILKIVAAVGGDVVRLRPDAVFVDGYPLPGSATQARDTHGRALAHIPRGTYRLRPGEVWLWTPNPKSWDSRYFGPLPVANVDGYANLMLAFWDWPYARVH